MPVKSLFLLLTLLFARAAPSQTPTAICKDGTTTTIPTRESACKGHKGIQTWYAPSQSVPSIPTPTPNLTLKSIPVPTPGLTPASIPAATPATSIAERRAYLLSQPPAPGAAPNLVWLNANGKVYHCPGSNFYGKTKSGSYLSEAEAKAKGAHPSRNKPCS
jgi:hypothetical protein